jgi:hypothetical protein
MKKTIAMVLTLLIVAMFALGCKPAEQPSEAPAPEEETTPAEQPATEQPAPEKEAH